MERVGSGNGRVGNSRAPEASSPTLHVGGTWAHRALSELTDAREIRKAAARIGREREDAQTLIADFLDQGFVAPGSAPHWESALASLVAGPARTGPALFNALAVEALEARGAKTQLGGDWVHHALTSLTHPEEIREVAQAIGFTRANGKDTIANFLRSGLVAPGTAPLWEEGLEKLIRAQ